ncbi:uncharacterized protein LOC117171376 [Belonocnema kinseyi]|uniref:uncharacterized protein LOC117171376 n=1 Tax=Belonocnema kinseyi TaxID=2817044 RepID=UPI00143CCA61|nr:uncharacterized protein LOC117171376 [Belonocnema kinseyi]
MSERFVCRILLLFSLAVAVYSQGGMEGPTSGDSGNGKTNVVASPIAVPPGVKNPKTVGIIGGLLEAFAPIRQIFLQLVESYLKNMYGKSLPCRLDSITPLKGECTDLKNP